MVQPKSRTSASKPAPARCASDRLTDLALASRSEIRIICKLLPPANPVPSKPLPNIDRILSADDELQPVLAKTRDLRALGGLVDGFFPPDLARQVRVANFREGELVLSAANPPAAAKIRLLAPSLTLYLAKQRWQVNSVSLRVQPTVAQGEIGSRSGPKTVHLSTPAVTALRNLYKGLQDSPAKRALGTLLRRHEGSKGGATSPADVPQTSGAASAPRGKGRP